MSRQPEYDERVAICLVDGGLSDGRAHRIAVEQMPEAGKSDCPDAWLRLNKWWHTAATSRYGRAKLEGVRDAIKTKHSVDSFTELTLGQIQDSIDVLEGSK